MIEHVIGEKVFNKIFGNAEQKLCRTIQKQQQAQGDKEDFRLVEYTNKDVPKINEFGESPIVIRNMADDWTCSKKWSFEYFSEKLGDTKVVLMNNPGLVKDSDQNYDEILLSDYIKRLKQGSKDYLKFSRMLEENSDVHEDVNSKALEQFKFGNSINERYYFFMGGKGTTTPIHNGFSYTVFVQAVGEKKWTFYPTNNRFNLGVRPKRLNYFYSDIDIAKVDGSKYLNFKEARKVEVVLKPGDVLCFAPWVFHQVENLTDTIAFAYKFANLKEGLKASTTLGLSFLMSTKPPLIYTLFPFLPDSNQYVKKKELI